MVTAVEIAREIGNDDDIKRKSRVAAFVDLPGVPEGTPGRVALVDGWDKWIRYHVLFDNGVTVGSVNRSDLVPVKRYAQFRSRRDDALASGVFDAPPVDETADDGGAAGGGEAGGDVEVNGVQVPGHLLERSKAARERLGA